MIRRKSVEVGCIGVETVEMETGPVDWGSDNMLFERVITELQVSTGKGG